MQITKEKLSELIDKKFTIRQISDYFSVSRSTIIKYLKLYELKVPNHHNALKFNNKVFDNIDTEEKAYWLGFLFADGYVDLDSNQVELSLKGDDIEHIKKFSEFIEHINPKTPISKIKVNGKEYFRCRFQVVDAYFKKRLISLGCTPQKSLTIKFPDEKIFKNKDIIRDFMRGYMDANGYIGFTKTGRIALSLNSTKEFLLEYIKYLPYTPSIFQIGNKNTYCIRSNCTKGEAIIDFLYKNATIYLKRKYKRYELAVLLRNQ